MMKKTKIEIIVFFCACLLFAGCVDPQKKSGGVQTAESSSAEMNGAQIADAEKKDSEAETASTEKQQNVPSPNSSESVLESQVLPPIAPANKSASTAENSSETETIQFRCAYWSRSDNYPQLFLKLNGEFKPCEIFELAFPRVYSLPADPRGIVLYADDGNGAYSPIIEINRHELKNCAAILLPNFADTELPLHQRVQIFSFDENEVPFGTLVIYNWFPESLAGEIKFRKNAQNSASLQTFRLNNGEHCTTLPIRGFKQMCDFELKNANSNEIIFSSSLPIFGESKTYIFMLPKYSEGQARLDFKIFSVHSQRK